MKMLRTKLYDMERTQAGRGDRLRARKSQVGTGDRSERIRTYNYPQGRVTDHRIGLTLYSLEKLSQRKPGRNDRRADHRRHGGKAEGRGG